MFPRDPRSGFSIGGYFEIPPRFFVPLRNFGFCSLVPLRTPQAVCEDDPFVITEPRKVRSCTFRNILLTACMGLDMDGGTAGIPSIPQQSVHALA